MAKKSSGKGKTREPPPTGVTEIDTLTMLDRCRIEDYVRAVSAYVRESSKLATGPKKAAQIRLSNALARALEADLRDKLPKLSAHVGERKVAGALRTVKADVSETHPLDGLRLAVEIKPINLAVGRAIWNRFGDIRTFAVNIHLKFPFAVVGGVLVIPTYEEIGTTEADEAAEDEAEDTEADGGLLSTVNAEDDKDDTAEASGVENYAGPRTKPTTHLIERAVQRLVRAGGRETEGDAPHLLEAISVVVYDPASSTLDPDLPPKGSRLRWDEFIDSLAEAYKGRFED